MVSVVLICSAGCVRHLQLLGAVSWPHALHEALCNSILLSKLMMMMKMKLNSRCQAATVLACSRGSSLLKQSGFTFEILHTFL